jgi:hypothetical protein
MNETIFSRRESMETPRPSQETWLSGVFETGGTLSFAISRNPKRPSYAVHPYISIFTSPKRVAALEDMFGGYINTAKQNSWKWEIKGSKAIELMEQMEPSSPSRKNAIETAKKIVEESSMEKRIKIVRNFRENGHRSSLVSQNQYKELLANPDFTAGVFDAIGTIDTAPYAPLRTQFESRNKALIDSLNKKFGGSISTRVKPGTRVTLKETSWVTVNPSYELTLAKEDSKNLLQLIAPHLRFNKLSRRI